MYSFGPIPRQKRTGRHVGTHQKIDRIARRHLEPYLDTRQAWFPSIREILHFEGMRGPDGVKMKSPGRDEPWHFIDPHDPEKDRRLLDDIANHQANLTTALQDGNRERAAFEAAWLAHAVTDGLTPAHHEVELEKIRADDEREPSVKTKLVMTGKGSKKEFIRNNWKYWGARGVMTSHTLFEGGIVTASKPLNFAKAKLHEHDIDHLVERGFEAVYLEMLDDIAHLDMYNRFKQTGWTRTLARQTANDLLPTAIRAVTLAWYDAVRQVKPESDS